MDHDGLFKELISTFFEDFIKLFAPAVSEYGDVSDVEMSATETFKGAEDVGQRRSDLVFRVRFTHDVEAVFLIHIEVQSQTEADFPRRMFHYFARLHEMHDVPIYPIALFAYDVVDRDEPNTVSVTFPDREILKFSFHRIQLKRIDWKEFKNHPNPIAAALMAKMGFDEDERARVKLECYRMLATLKLDPDKTRFIGQFVEAYLPLDEYEIEEYNVMKEVLPMAEKQGVTEILTYWERLGLEKGLEEGLEKGQKMAMRKTARTLIESRYGLMPDQDITKLDKLALEELEALVLAVVHVNTYDELQDYLSPHHARN